MKFSELPVDSYFAVIKPEETMLLLAKDCRGRIRKALDWSLVGQTDINDGTEVQPIQFKKPSHQLGA